MRLRSLVAWSARSFTSRLLCTLALGALLLASSAQAQSYDVRDSGDATPGAPVYAAEDISGTGTNLGLSDDGNTGVTLPFDFTFYGLTATQLTIGNNGAVIFGTLSGNVEYNNLALTDAGTPNYLIAPFWDDLTDDAGDVFTQTLGDAPNRRFVVQWNGLPHFNNIGAATFRLELHESSNAIVFQYDDVLFGDVAFDDGAAATIGIRGADETVVEQYSFNTSAVSDNFAIRFHSAFEDAAAGLAGAYTGNTAWADYDNDGDLDALLTGFDGASTVATIYRNDDGAFTDVDPGFDGFSNSVASWGDFDADGDPDVVLGGWNGSAAVARLYRNDGGDVFTDVSITLPGMFLGAAAWADYDNDGDMDLLLTGHNGTAPFTTLFRNDGSDGLGGWIFTDAGVGLTGVSNSDAAWGDYDNDGDPDLLIAGKDATKSVTTIYRNDGGSFVNIKATLPNVNNGDVAWGDVDGDGDLDALVAGLETSTAVTALYENVGGGTFTDTGTLLTPMYLGSVAFGDHDNDGALDLLMSGFDGTSSFTKLYRGDGSTGFTEQVTDLPALSSSDLALGDYDGDGDLDVLLAGLSGSSPLAAVYDGNALTTNTLPTAPGSLAFTSVGGNRAILTWGTGTDAETADAALSYNLRIGTTSGGFDVVVPMSIVDITTGLGKAGAALIEGTHKIPRAGNVGTNTGWAIEGLQPNTTYYWSVQSIDDTFAGSAFATEATFTTLGPDADAAFALDFDGVDEYVQVDHDDRFNFGTGAFTLEAWIQRDGSGVRQDLITKKDLNSGTDHEMILHLNTADKLRLYLRTETGNDGGVVSADAIGTDWTHVAATRDDEGTVTLYINGVEQKTDTITEDITSTGPIRFGATRANGNATAASNNEFDGRMDEVRIWNRARTGDEINTAYLRALSGGEAGLVGYWQFNEGIDFTAGDVAGTFDGTLTNMETPDDWVASTVPFGAAATALVSGTGLVEFLDTGVEMNFTELFGEQTVIVTRIDAAPDMLPSSLTFQDVFDSQYWTFEAFGTGTFLVDVTFTIAESLTAADAATPGQIKLFTRDAPGEPWRFVTSAASAGGNQAQFTGLDTFSEFLLVRGTEADFAFDTMLTFDGTGDAVDVGVGSPEGSLTYETWFMLADGNTSERYLMGVQDDCNEGSRYLRLEDDPSQELTFQVAEDGATSCTTVSFDDFNTDQWYHVAAVLDADAGEIYLYVDGILRDSATLAAGSTFDTLLDNFSIGRRPDQSSSVFEGSLEETRVWNTARTEGEIQDTMFFPRSGGEDGLVAYYGYNTDAVSAAPDYAGGHDGTFEGDPSRETSTLGVVSRRTEMPGNVTFGSTGLTMAFTTESGASVDVARIDTAPTTVPNGVTTLDSQYWVIQRDGSGFFSAALTFEVAENLTNSDASLPSQIQLHTRGDSGDEWTLLNTATEVNATDESARFDDIVQFSQFVVARGSILTTGSLSATDDIFEEKVEVNWSGITEMAATLKLLRIEDFAMPTADTTLLSFLGSDVTDYIDETGDPGIYYEYCLEALDSADEPVDTVCDTGSRRIFPPTSVDATDGTLADFTQILWVDRSDVEAGYNVYLDPVLMYDGSNDYVRVDDDADFDFGTGAFTLEMWFRPDSLDRRQELFSKTNLDNTGAALRVYIDTDNTVQFVTVGPTGTEVSVNSSSAVDSAWVYLAATRASDGTMKLYLDGVEEASLAASGQNTDTNGPLRIGAARMAGDALANPEYLFAGLLDEVRVWNIARSGTQLRDNAYGALAGSESGLVAYWGFNEGENTESADATGNGHTATLDNMLPETGWLPTAPVSLAEENTIFYDDEIAKPGFVTEYCITAWTDTDDDGVFTKGIDFESVQVCDDGFRGFILPPLFVNATDGQYPDMVELTWTDQADNELEYRITRDGATLATLAPDTERYEDLTVVDGVTYTYCVITVGEDLESLAICDDGGIGILPSPTDLAASDDEFDDKVALTWTDPGNVEDAFRIYRRDLAMSDSLLVAEVDADTEDYDDTSAQHTVDYRYCIVSVAYTDVDGDGTDDQEVESASACDDGRQIDVLAPTLVAATDSTYEDLVEVSWENISTTAVLMKTYRRTVLDYDADPMVFADDSVLVKTISTAETGFESVNIASGTVYRYCVVGVSAAGDTSEPVCDLGNRLLSTPTSVDATDDAAEAFTTVTWFDASAAEAGYYVYRTPETPYALSFDGLDDEVVVDEVMETSTGDFTLETWVKITSLPPAPQRIVQRGSGGGDADATGWSLALLVNDDGTFSGSAVHNAPGRIDVQSTSVLSLNTWIHLALVWEAGEVIQLYVDGVLEDELSVSPTVLRESDTGLVMGSRGDGVDHFEGWIDEVQLWGSARTDQDIADDMSSHLGGTELYLLGYWPMDEGSGLSTSDATGDGHVGILQNGTLWDDLTTMPIGLGGGNLATLGIDRDEYEDRTGATGVTYTYEVTAFDVRGESSPGSDTGQRTIEQPTDVAATDGTAEEAVTVTWTDNSRVEEGFRIYRDDAFLATVGARVTSYEDSDIAFGQSYVYDVEAFDDYGATPSDGDAGDTDILAPSSVQASEVYVDEVVITWVDESVIESGFVISRDGSDIFTTAANATTYTDDTGVANFPYSYCVRAVSGLAVSAEVCDTGTANSTSGGITLGPIAVGNVGNEFDRIVPVDFGKGFGRSVSVDGDYSVIGGAFEDGTTNDGAYFYMREGDDWEQMQVEGVPSGASPSHAFGWDVDLQDPYALVSAPYEDHAKANAGKVYLYQRESDGWSLSETFDGTGGGRGVPDTDMLFGYSVALDGNIAAGGAPFDHVSTSGNITGAVFIYTRQGSTWDAEPRLVAESRESGDKFGWDIALDGSTILIGAPGDNGSAGSAYFAYEQNGEWGELSGSERVALEADRVLADDPNYCCDRFGESVALDGDWAVVGAPGDEDNGSDAGAVHIYYNDPDDGADTWATHTKLFASDAGADNEFGASVSLEGDFLLVGAPARGSSTGKAYLYRLEGEEWVEVDRILASNSDTGIVLGTSLDLDAEAAFIGMPGTGTGLSIGFDGVDDRVEVAHNDALNIDGGDSFSIEAWAKFTTDAGGGANDAVLMEKWDGSVDGYPYSMRVERTGELVCEVQGRVTADALGTFTAGDIQGTGTGENLSGDGTVNVTMPFEFTFFDRISDQLLIGTNGAILFGELAGTISGTNTALSGAQNYLIAPFWDDLAVKSSPTPFEEEIYYETSGTSPNRTFTVQWDGLNHNTSAGTDSVTFRVVFEETSNVLTFHYDDVTFGDAAEDGGASATIGVRGGSSADILEFTANSGSAAVAAGDARSYSYTVTTVTATSSTTQNDDTWHHLACVHDADGNILRAYVDGVQRGTDTYTDLGSTANEEPLFFGGRGASADAFEGNLHEMRLWSYARSATEISSNKDNALSGAEDDLTAYWPFSEDSGGTTVDLVGGNNGSLLPTGEPVQSTDASFIVDVGGNVLVVERSADPSDVGATDGTNDSNVQITWEDNSNNEENFLIYRDEKLIGETTPNVRSFNDFDAPPGDLSEYCVTSFREVADESFEVCNYGWRPANGSISGRVSARAGAGIDSVIVGIEPVDADGSTASLYHSLQLDGFAITGTDEGGHARVEDLFVPEGADLMAFTVSFWMKSSDTANEGTPFSYAYEDGTGATVNNGIALIDNQSFDLWVAGDQATTGVAVNDGAWHHVAVTWDNTGQYYLMLDGTVAAEGTGLAVGEFVNADGVLVFGQDQDNLGGGFASGMAFDGQLDDLKFWSVARDTSDIAAERYMPLLGEEEDLIAYWPFDQGEGSAGLDQSPNANHALLADGAYWAEDIAPLEINVLSDSDGNYTLNRIRYGSGTTFEVKPEKGVRFFEPGVKELTLNTETPLTNDVFFTDVSSFSISGVVNYAGTNCPVDSVEVYVDDFFKDTTEPDGFFAVAADMGDRVIRPSLELDGLTHVFTPSSSTLDLQGDVEDINFEDNTTRTLNGFVGGSCSFNIGTATLKFFTADGCFEQEVEASGPFELDLPPQTYFVQVVDIQDIPAGINKADVISFFDDLGIQEINVAATDSLDIIYRAPLDMNLNGFPEAPICPTGIDQLAEDASVLRTLPIVPIIDEFEIVPITIEVFEDYGDSGTCPVDVGTITVFDEIADAEEEQVFEIEAGQVDYLTVGVSPNVFSGAIIGGEDRSFQKSLTVVAEVEGRDPLTVTEWAIVNGFREREATFVSATTEEMPLMILHDPPGSNSYAYIEEGTTVCQSLSTFSTFGGSGGFDFDIAIGFKAGTGFSFGAHFEVGKVGVAIRLASRTMFGRNNTSASQPLTDEEIDDLVDFYTELGVDAELIERARQIWANTETNIEVCATTTERWSTSSDMTWVGEDIFMGVALNLIFAEADVITADGGSCSVTLTETLATDLDEETPFKTDYVYGGSHIDLTLIPELEGLADKAGEDFVVEADINDDGTISASEMVTLGNAIDNWQSHLDLGDELVERGIDEEFIENRSFSGGTEYEYSEVSDTTRLVYAQSTNIFIDSENLVGLIAEVAGFDQTGNIAFTVNRSWDTDSTATEGTSSAIGYVLSDGDTGDFFSVDIGRDPQYGTFVFETVSGRSSNPWEGNTQKRDNPLVSIDPPVLFNQDPDDAGRFALTITNGSESQEQRQYKILVPGETNTRNLGITITGDLLGGDRLETVTLPAGESVTLNMDVFPSPSAFTYEDVAVMVYPEIEYAIWQADTRQTFALSDTARFSVYFDAPCSDVNILRPLENMLRTVADGTDPFEVILDGFGLAVSETDSVEAVGLEYRLVGESVWLPAFSVTSDDIIATGFEESYTTTEWPATVETFPDGDYELRAFTSCPTGTVTSEVVPITWDTSPPALFGPAQPSDGVLNPGDPIMATFAETLECSTLIDTGSLQNVMLNKVNTDGSVGDAVDYTMECNDDTIILTPDVDDAEIENLLLRARILSDVVDVSGNIRALTDEVGNDLAETISWDFTVRQSGFNWSPVNLDLALTFGEETTTLTSLVNGRGQAITYDLPGTFDLLPDGGGDAVPVAVSDTSGTIVAGGAQVIMLTLPDSLGVGTYTGTLAAEGLEATLALGDAILTVVAEVSCNVPTWTLDPAAFQYSMTLTGEIEIDGVTSSDLNDVVIARSGGAVRGIGYVDDASGSPLVQMLIYGNVTGGEAIALEVWDDDACTLYEEVSPLLTFVPDAIQGTPSNPTTIVAPAVLSEQTVFFSSGWTWFSVNTDAPSTDVDDVLEGLNAAEGDIVKSQTAFSLFDPDFGWTGVLGAIVPGEGYLINLSQTSQLVLAGTPVVATSRPISVSAGWNWIGFHPSEPIPVNEALATLNSSASAGDVIKSQYGFAQFVNSSTGWVGSLTTMEPGLGYQINLSSAGTLTYPNTASTAFALETGEVIADNTGMTTTGTPALGDGGLTTGGTPTATAAATDTRPGNFGKEAAMERNASGTKAAPVQQATAADVAALTADGERRGPSWHADARGFPSTMTLTAEVRLDGELLADPATKLGVFAGDALRGVGQPRYVKALGQYLTFLTVYGDEERPEALTFRLYDAKRDAYVTSEADTLYFTANALMGAVDAPVVVNLRSEAEGAQETGLPTSYTLYAAYPNPFNPQTTIRYDLPEPGRVVLEVFDPVGRRVALLVDEEQRAGRYTLRYDGRDLASGVYFYRLRAGSYNHVHQMVLLK